MAKSSETNEIACKRSTHASSVILSGVLLIAVGLVACSGTQQVNPRGTSAMENGHRKGSTVPCVPPGTPPPSPAGITWPANQDLPTFSTPTTTFDIADFTSNSMGMQNVENQTFILALQGLFNRQRPQIYVYASALDQQWLQSAGLLSHGTSQPFSTLVKKYYSYAKGLVLYPSPSGSSSNPLAGAALNMAVAIAGAYGDLPAAEDQTSVQKYLPTVADVWGCAQQAANTDAVYAEELQDLWSGTGGAGPARLVVSLDPSNSTAARDYATALGAPIVWTDPGTATGQALIQEIANGSFGKSLQPDSPWFGWWPSEVTGIAGASQYGIYTAVTESFNNATFWSGVPASPSSQTRGRMRARKVPTPSSTFPPVIITIMVSSGENIAMDEGQLWSDMLLAETQNPPPPINWSISPELSYVAPFILQQWQNAVLVGVGATPGPELIGGASGSGYMFPEPTTTVSPFGSESQADLQKYTQNAGAVLATAGMNVTYVLNHDPGVTSKGTSTFPPDAGADYANAGVQGIFDLVRPGNTNAEQTYPLPNPATSPMVIVSEPYQQTGGGSGSEVRLHGRSGSPSCSPGSNCDWLGYVDWIQSQMTAYNCSSASPCFLSLSIGPDGNNQIADDVENIMKDAALKDTAWFVDAEQFFHYYCQVHNYPCFGNDPKGRRTRQESRERP